MVVWWSAAFPGFGHYLLNQYIRATLLTLAEIIINTLAHINEAIIYTFCGHFDMAKSVLQPRWILGYIIIYIYALWDSYRTVLVQNKLCHIARLQKASIETMAIYPGEIQYIEQKRPLTAAIYSFLFPGLGQLYNHRFFLGFYIIFWWWIYIALSGIYESIIMIILGNVEGSIPVLNPHWLLFMPSVLGGSVYDAFLNCRGHNKLFQLEQRKFLEDKYQNYDFRIFS